MEEKDMASRNTDNHLCADAGPCPRSQWCPIDTAPEGVAVDLWLDGERLIEFTRRGSRWEKVQGYPTFTTVLTKKPTHWMYPPARPDGGEAVHGQVVQPIRDEPSNDTRPNTIEVGKPMPYFCPACQAIPRAGFCKLAGCPTAPSSPNEG